MPMWIGQALKLLGGLTAGGAAFDFLGGPADQGLVPFGPQLPSNLPRNPLIPDFIERGVLGRTGRQFGHRRRRRRRALTASDKADIAFIAGILGKAAGANFAVSLAARPR